MWVLPRPGAAVRTGDTTDLTLLFQTRGNVSVHSLGRRLLARRKTRDHLVHPPLRADQELPTLRQNTCPRLNHRGSDREGACQSPGGTGGRGGHPLPVPRAALFPAHSVQLLPGCCACSAPSFQNIYTANAESRSVPLSASSSHTPAPSPSGVS